MSRDSVNAVASGASVYVVCTAAHTTRAAGKHESVIGRQPGVKLASPKAAVSATEQGRVSNFPKSPSMDSYEVSSAFGALRHNASRINIMSRVKLADNCIFWLGEHGVSEPREVRERPASLTAA